MKELHYGEGYQYAHDSEDKLTNMQCLPDSLARAQLLPPDRAGLRGPRSGTHGPDRRVAPGKHLTRSAKAAAFGGRFFLSGAPGGGSAALPRTLLPGKLAAPSVSTVGSAPEGRDKKPRPQTGAR